MKPDRNPPLFSRTITFGVLLTLSIQTASGLIWVGATDARLRTVELQMVQRTPAYERVALLDGQMSMITHSLDRIERQIIDHALSVTSAEKEPLK